MKKYILLAATISLLALNQAQAQSPGKGKVQTQTQPKTQPKAQTQTQSYTPYPGTCQPGQDPKITIQTNLSSDWIWASGPYPSASQFVGPHSTILVGENYAIQYIDKDSLKVVCQENFTFQCGQSYTIVVNSTNTGCTLSIQQNSKKKIIKR